MRFFVYILFTLLTFKTHASHIVGGEMYYDYLGSNQYRFFIIIYRDCDAPTQYDDPMSLGVFTSSGQLVQDVSVPFPGKIVLPNNFNNPCATNPPYVCTEKAVYTVVLTLPPTPGGYTVSYQRCCRGPNVTNIISPDDVGLTLSAHVPGSETGATVNSSPRYTNYPPLILCSNEQLVFNHSATDPDGDQLVYSLVTPYAGATPGSPMPSPPPPPNYPNVSWIGGFSAAQPLGPGSSVTINSSTGILTVNPNMLGLFVVGVRVQEYRNGVLIGQTVRDFLFKVFNCNIVLQAILPLQEDLPTFISYCQGLTVNFVNNSYGGTSYAWDFGVPGVTTDVSTVQTPVFTYPVSGTYQVRLIVNPGSACTDTAYQTIIVNNLLDVSFTSQDSLCIVGNDFDFVGNYIGDPGATLQYTFGPNASIASASTLNVNNVSFSTPGNHTITLTADKGQCHDSFVKNIFIFDLPTPDFTFPTNYQCNGLTVPFTNQSNNANNYTWDFGVNGTNADVSNAVNPSFTFPAEGSYNIQLIAGSNGTCKDTLIKTIQVYEPLVLSFTHNDSLCITGNSFNFDGTYTGSPTTQFSYNFGNDAVPLNANTLDVSNVVYSNPGIHSVTLTGTYANTCVQSYSSQLFIFKEPTINFALAPGLQCAPFTAYFTDLSSADSPILYLWNFGDGSTSTQQNPVHVYTNVGNYSVGLQIITTQGCKDTLYMFKQDLINVHPNPVAGFSINPILTDICHAEITFTDVSQGSDSTFYLTDEGTVFNQANGMYTYTTSGQHYPRQIVINQWGCSDTMRLSLAIEPFVIYAPNTITPDGDEVNNVFLPKKALETIEWELTIYNRWGELLFTSTDPNEGWDATFENQLVPDGVYAYVIRYISCELPGVKQQINGHVNVLK